MDVRALAAAVAARWRSRKNWSLRAVSVLVLGLGLGTRSVVFTLLGLAGLAASCRDLPGRFPDLGRGLGLVDRCMELEARVLALPPGRTRRAVIAGVALYSGAVVFALLTRSFALLTFLLTVAVAAGLVAVNRSRGIDP